MPVALELRDVTGPDDPDLWAFHEALKQVFADPRQAITAEGLRRLMEPGEDLVGHCLVARVDGRVVGGSQFRYLPGPNTAFSGYLFLLPEARGQGVARRVVEERLRILHEEARRRGHPGVYALFIDVADPGRMSPEEYEWERRHIMDPRERRAFMRHLGFRKLDFRFTPLPMAPGEAVPDYFDILAQVFHPEWRARGAVPGDAIVATFAPMWRRINPADAEAALARLAREVVGRWVPLVEA